MVGWILRNSLLESEMAILNTMLVRRFAIAMLLIGAPVVTYAVGQWIDGDNLILGLELHPFWQFQIRSCPAC